MIIAKRVLDCDEIMSFCHDNGYPYSLGSPCCVRLELFVTDDGNLFEDVDMRFDHC